MRSRRARSQMAPAGTLQCAGRPGYHRVRRAFPEMSRKDSVHLYPGQRGKNVNVWPTNAGQRRIAAGVAQQHRQNGRCVPVDDVRCQRPPSRSSCSQLWDRLSGSTAGSGISLARDRGSGSMSPRSSSHRTPSTTDRSFAPNGTSLATLRPRCVRTHSSPRSTARSNSLRRAFASRTPISRTPHTS